ncbi:hypothetical protein ACWFQ8_03955 [Streptomyces sp. NPDC055254]
MTAATTPATRRCASNGAAVKVRDQDHLAVVALADENPARGDRPRIVRTLLEGRLGPAA